jgi:hypothetical protein
MHKLIAKYNMIMIALILYQLDGNIYFHFLEKVKKQINVYQKNMFDVNVMQ